MKSFLLFAFLVSNTLLWSQYSFDAEIRPRFENRSGYKSLPKNDTLSANFITQRSRLGVTYLSKKITLRMSVQDTRTWGEEGLKEDLPSIGLSEGYFIINVNDSLSFTAGRLNLVYDNQRLISNTNWAQRQLTHDAFVINFKINGWAIQSVNAYNQIGDPLFATDYSAGYIKKNYKFLNYIFLKKDWNHFQISPIFIADGFQRRKTINVVDFRFTTGSMLQYQIGKHSISMRAFYQFGNDTAGTDIAAYYLNSDYLLKLSKKLNMSLGFELISGNDANNNSNSKVNYFSTLYGAGHAFNGYMDYFTDIPKDTKKAGLVNPYFKTGYTLNEKLSVMLDLHYFQLLNNHIAVGTSNKFLAFESDLGLRWQVIKEVQISTGFSYLSGSETLKSFYPAGNYSSNAYWGYFMVTVKPK